MQRTEFAGFVVFLVAAVALGPLYMRLAAFVRARATAAAPAE